MSSRPVFRASALALIALLIASCGNKGDLVKPTPATPPTPAVPADATQPATH